MSSHEDRERDRYRRASFEEQIGGAIESFWHNRTARLVAAIGLAWYLVIRLISPQVIGFEQLVAGDCVYIRALQDPSLVSRLAGSVSAVRTALLEQGAERASCDQSHSHEVAFVADLADPVPTAYPGSAALEARESEACRVSMDVYVGAADAFELIVVPPDAARWDGGIRRVVCLLGRRDGAFLDRPARVQP